MNATVLPTAGAGVISAEYGSSSEGLLHLSGDGSALIEMGYGVAAVDFNADPTAYGTTTTGSTRTTALAQSGSLGLTDRLSAAAPATGELFQTLATAPAGSNFKGVSFAPTAAGAVPEPATYATLIAGFALAGDALRRRRAAERTA